MGDQQAVYETSIEGFSVVKTFSVDPPTITRITELVQIFEKRFRRNISQGHVLRMAVKDFYDRTLEEIEAEDEGARGVMDE